MDTISIDDNPLITAVVAKEGCGTHDNTCKVAGPSSLRNSGETSIAPALTSSRYESFSSFT